MSRKKPKSILGALKQFKESRQLAKEQPNNQSKDFFKKHIIDHNITVYSSSDLNYIHFKDNQTGFGGTTLRLPLEDGTVEACKGPFFLHNVEEYI